MTKKQMIHEIQVAEARAWKEFQRAKHIWGREDALTNKLGSRWHVVYELREALGFEGLPLAELIALDLVPA